jgi:Na+-driven multidrug efflux pump
MAVQQCFSGVMRGAGDSIGPMWISIITNVVLRLPLTFALVAWTTSAERPNGDPNSIFYSMLITLVIGAVITLIYYKSGKWRNKAIVESPQMPSTELA